MNAPTRYEALKMVADHFPTQDAMAECFGVSQPTIWRWLNQSKQLPAEHVLAAEEVTGVPRHFLRPDIYPTDLGPSPDWPAGNGDERAAAMVSLHQPHTPNRSAAA